MPGRERGSRSLRVGIAYAGKVDSPAVWSGILAGIARGLEEAGVETTYVSAYVPAGLVGPALAARSWTRSLRARRSAPAGAPAEPAEAPAWAPAAEAAPRPGVGGRWPSMATLYALAFLANRPRAGSLDALVQGGTHFTIPFWVRAPYVTYDDLTVAQGLRHPPPGWRAPSRRALEARLAGQRRSYERARACCVTVQWVADSIVSDYGIDQAKVHLVGIGRNHELEPSPRDWSRPRFLFVGRDWERKNGPAVVRAFSRLREQIPDARLDLVGVVPRIEVEGVTVHGKLSMHVPDESRRLKLLFREATCFVMPSRFEPAGLVFTEAAAAGLPSIGTKVGGSRDVIGDAGRVVDPRSDEELLEAMLELSNPDTAARLGALAERRAPLFTWRAVGERILRALELPGVDRGSLADFL